MLEDQAADGIEAMAQSLGAEVIDASGCVVVRRAEAERFYSAHM